MDVSRSFALFFLSLLLAFIAFPIVFSASAAAGYAMCLAAVSIGVYLTIRRAGTLQLILRIVLAIIGAAR